MATTNLICRLEFVDSGQGVGYVKAGATSNEWRVPTQLTFTSADVQETRRSLATCESVTIWQKTSQANEIELGLAVIWTDASAGMYLATFTSADQTHQHLRQYHPYIIGSNTSVESFYSATTTLTGTSGIGTTDGVRIYRLEAYNTGSIAILHSMAVGTD